MPLGKIHLGNVTRGFGSFIGLGIIGALMTAGSCDAQVDSQQPTGIVVTMPPEIASLAPLTVRPREMATGTSTPRAGQYALDSLDNYLVYVPRQCVGQQRCPLVVALHPFARKAKNTIENWGPVSDKYGMIVLAPTKSPGDPRWRPVDQKNIDAAMKQCLRTLAIDPEKIAIAGYSASGIAVQAFAGRNLDVFSRVILASADVDQSRLTTDFDPQNTTTEFLVATSYMEHAFTTAKPLRQAGHPVKEVINLRDHGMQSADYDFLGRWLQQSWATPTPTARPAPALVTDSMPLLTTDVLAKMTDFWTRFQAAPDSILTAARLAHLREVVVPLAEARPSALMVDMPALAAQYPSVAAALKAAGLTAQDHEAYRVALIGAAIVETMEMGSVNERFINVKPSAQRPISIEKTSATWRNFEFMTAHGEESNALAETGMWSTP